ncbi:MAG: hypothetical protein LC808_08660 [Actinobacteria bacterium]|nr:hypothetical protein [Actinomycetota bacterium]
MSSYNFTLIVEGVDLQTDEAQESLFEAGCDDATFGVVDSVQFAEFDREAGSYGRALTSAIAAIQRAIKGARVVHVLDDLVTISDIAERVERSRESVRLLIAGKYFMPWTRESSKEVTEASPPCPRPHRG